MAYKRIRFSTSHSVPSSLICVSVMLRGVVKQVLDGGAVVIRGPPRNGPPAERTLALTNIDAPRLGTVHLRLSEN